MRVRRDGHVMCQIIQKHIIHIQGKAEVLCSGNYVLQSLTTEFLLC